MATEHEIKICMGSSCFARGNKLVLEKINSFLEINQLKDRVNFRGHHCFDDCFKGPTIMVDGVSYYEMNPEKVVELLEKLFLKK